MGYESLSTVVVLVIVVIFLVGWLPARTIASMRKVIEHREDQFSTSLHLVDGDSGTRFSDERTPQAKGIIMRPSQSAKYTAEYVARVRKARAEAIRRRRIIVLSLLVITVVVLVCAVVRHFSALFALIPGVLLALVLALGVRASRQAREWERRVAQERRAGRYGAADRAGAQRAGAQRAGARSDRGRSDQSAKARGMLHASRADGVRGGAAGASGPVAAGDAARSGVSSDMASSGMASAASAKAAQETSTEVMEQREIRRALRASRDAQQQAVAARRERQEQRALRDGSKAISAGNAAASVAPVASSASAAAPSGASPAAVASSVPAAPVESAAETSASVASTAAVAGDARPSQDLVRVDEQQPSDETNELAHVKPARTLDAFAVAAQQDLISFSLGSPRNGEQPQPAAPESLEIKSTRQVAKAVPVAADAAQVGHVDTAERGDTTAAMRSGADGRQIGGGDDRPAEDAAAASVVNAADALADETASSFHDREVDADVEAPAATGDSLGANLQAVLARRSV
ncbi:hypothetical protein [Bifidobacterium jacchi]|uniref:Uncharacterized protein n=1 Tax=Bifidobacterium jacchi TaxID=2490545 RepID=A0A5N5RML0_9BIFI|nr:hypothetical protein [Bifidobacterium jacchi]KAB5608180.1 hypothetical protein EHS19_02360 [Bifidobacterium jacchi]